MRSILYFLLGFALQLILWLPAYADFEYYYNGTRYCVDDDTTYYSGESIGCILPELIEPDFDVTCDYGAGACYGAITSGSDCNDGKVHPIIKWHPAIRTNEPCNPDPCAGHCSNDAFDPTCGETGIDCGYDPDCDGSSCTACRDCVPRCPTGYTFHNGFCISDDFVGTKPNPITRQAWFAMFGTYEGWEANIPLRDVRIPVQADEYTNQSLINWGNDGQDQQPLYPSDLAGNDYNPFEDDSIDWVEIDLTDSGIDPDTQNQMQDVAETLNTGSDEYTIEGDINGDHIIRDAEGNIIKAVVSGEAETVDNGDGTTTETTVNQEVKDGELITTTTTTTKDSNGNVIDSNTTTKTQSTGGSGSGDMSAGEKVAAGAGSGDGVTGDQYASGVGSIVGAIQGDGEFNAPSDEGEGASFDVGQNEIESGHDWRSGVDSQVENAPSAWKTFFESSGITTSNPQCSIDGVVSIGGRSVNLSFSMCEFESIFQTLGVLFLALTELTAIFIVFRGLD